MEFNEFLELYREVRKDKKSFGHKKSAEKAKKLVRVSGLSEASDEGMHQFLL